MPSQYDKKLCQHNSPLNTSADIRMFGSWDVSDEKRQAFSSFLIIFIVLVIFIVFLATVRA